MSEQFPVALAEGKVLAGQYVIEKVLGQGGFGITYSATDYHNGQRVAIKEFFPEGMVHREASVSVIPYTGDRQENFEYGKECFIQEAKTLSQFIGVDSIIRIQSLFEENGTAYFVMEYVVGTSFDAYLKERGGKISFEEAAKILVPIMDALAIVHSRGIIHRDVTPDNIYITGDGKVKLLDFGAARYSLGDKSRSLDVVLKHGFAPKEQYARHGRQGPYTDIYSLGASFYFALTGKRPPDSIERLDEDNLIAPSALGVAITKEAENAILKALAVKAEDRFQTMSEFKNALLGVMPQAQPQVQPQAQPQVQPQAQSQVQPQAQPQMQMPPQKVVPNSMSVNAGAAANMPIGSANGMPGQIASGLSYEAFVVDPSNAKARMRINIAAVLVYIISFFMIITASSEDLLWLVCLYLIMCANTIYAQKQKKLFGPLPVAILLNIVFVLFNLPYLWVFSEMIALQSKYEDYKMKYSSQE